MNNTTTMSQLFIENMSAIGKIRGQGYTLVGRQFCDRSSGEIFAFGVFQCSFAVSEETFGITVDDTFESAFTKMIENKVRDVDEIVGLNLCFREDPENRRIYHDKVVLLDGVQMIYVKKSTGTSYKLSYPVINYKQMPQMAQIGYDTGPMKVSEVKKEQLDRMDDIYGIIGEILGEGPNHMGERGEPPPLMKITADNIKYWDVKGEPSDDLSSFQTFAGLLHKTTWSAWGKSFFYDSAMAPRGPIGPI